MSKLVAKPVTDLYSKQLVDWNFEYMRASSHNEPYIVVVHAHEAISEKVQKGETVQKKEVHEDIVLGPDVNYGPRPDLSRTKKEDTVHWLSLLPFYTSKVELLKIDGLKLDGPKIKFHVYDMTGPHDASALQTMLDYAATIYTYDSDRFFALLRRIMDDNALIGDVTPLKECKYMRQAPWFFGEAQMIQWRYRCRDIRSGFPTKSYNRDIDVQVLMANHVEEVDPRGGVYVAYQALCMTFLGGMQWDHVHLEY